MPVKILLTADVHLGLKFAGFPSVQKELAEARYNTLQRIVDLANARSCDLLVVAGDLFDHSRVADKEIVRAAQLLIEFSGKLVAVLPGNHDFFSPLELKLWPKFKQSAGDRVQLLEKGEVYDLNHYGVDAALYPGPCCARTSETNAVEWIRQALKDPSIRFHIGIAHGSLQGVSPDDASRYYPMTKESLAGLGLDLWLLGHTDRLQYPQAPGPFDRTFYPGTPEPNAFNCVRPGKCWIIELGDDKTIRAESVETGKYRFLHESRILTSAADVTKLQEWFERPEISSSLVKLYLSGRLAPEVREDLMRALPSLEQKAFYLEHHIDDLKTLITPEMIREEFSEGSFPHRLLSTLGRNAGDQDALQLAYELVKEVRR